MFKHFLTKNSEKKPNKSHIGKLSKLSEIVRNIKNTTVVRIIRASLSFAENIKYLVSSIEVKPNLFISASVKWISVKNAGFLNKSNASIITVNAIHTNQIQLPLNLGTSCKSVQITKVNNALAIKSMTWKWVARTFLEACFLSTILPLILFYYVSTFNRKTKNIFWIK